MSGDKRVPTREETVGLHTRLERRYGRVMSKRERISVELDAGVASRLRERAAEAQVSEGEIVDPTGGDHFVRPLPSQTKKHA